MVSRLFWEVIMEEFINDFCKTLANIIRLEEGEENGKKR